MKTCPFSSGTVRMKRPGESVSRDTVSFLPCVTSCVLYDEDTRECSVRRALDAIAFAKYEERVTKQ